jgi:site-specific recombinase XerD
MFPQVEIEDFRRYWYRRKPGTSTAIHYASDVSIFFTWVQDVAPEAVTVHHVDQFIEWQRSLGRSPTTIRRRIIALRMFYDYLAYARDQDLPNPILPQRHYVSCGDPLPRAVSEEVLQRLFAAIGDHRRDRAIFTLMLHTGLRVSEVAQLHIADVQLGAQGISRLHVIGKGRRERVVYLSPTAVEFLRDYLTLRPSSGSDRVFLNQRGQPITVTGIQLQLVHYCRQAEIWVTCHQLRHTFACRLIAADVPVTSVQKLLGHASLRTTQRYIQVADSQVERDYRASILKVSVALRATPSGGQP